MKRQSSTIEKYCNDNLDIVLTILWWLHKPSCISMNNMYQNIYIQHETKGMNARCFISMVYERIWKVFVCVDEKKYVRIWIIIVCVDEYNV